MADHDQSADRVTEYVLGHLDGRARTEFEARLAASPTLRAEVQALETARDALALSAPQLKPRAAVWQRIAEQTGSRPQRASESVSLAQWIGAIFWRGGWAMAALLALILVWLGRHRFTDRQEEIYPRIVERDAFPSGDGLPDSSPSSTETTLEGQEGTSVAFQAQPEPEADPAKPAPNGRGTDDQQRMRAWVQQLAIEVAELQRRLDRETFLPAGASRFQVFRLSSTNPPSQPPFQVANSDEATLQQRAMEQWLAGLLAQQLLTFADDSPDPGVQDLPSEFEEPDPASVPDSGSFTNLASVSPPPSSLPSSLEVLELASVPSAPSATDGMPMFSGDDSSSPSAALGPGAVQNMGLGFYSPDTGRGSLTLNVTDPIPEGMIFQFWAYDHENGQSISLGTTDSTGVPLLVHFFVDPEVIHNPGIMVTMEPVGGSPSPSGRVVLRPPSVVLPFP